MIKVSVEKSEFHEDDEVIFWNEETKKPVSPSLAMSFLMNGQMKVIRKFNGRHNPVYETPLDYDYYLVPKE